MKRSALTLIIPLTIGAIIMLPRLISPQFGLFDDPGTLETVERVSKGTWTLDDEAGSGRFRPVYWYFYTFIYLLSGASPFWFMFGNLVLFFGITVGVILIVRLYGLSNLQAGIAGSLFVLAGPIIENVYTLSKGELQQTFWLVGAVVLALQVHKQKNTSKREILYGVAIAAVLLISFTSKETSLAVISISTGWVLIAAIRKWRRIEDIPEGLRIRSTFFIATIISIAAYFGVRSAFMPIGISSSGYSSNYVFSLERFLDSGRVWIDWLNRDFLFLLPLALIGILMLATQKRFYENIIMIDAGIWMIGWIAVFLPWIHQQEYYLLPFSVGAAIFAGAIVGYFISGRKAFDGKWYALSGILLGVSIVLLFFTLLNNLTQAKLQLMIDRTNDEIISYLRDELPDNSSLYVNLSDDNQYFNDLKSTLFELGGRDDLAIEAYVNNGLSREGFPGDSTYVLAPYLTNQYYPSIRMGVFQNLSTEWNRLMIEDLGDQLEPLYDRSGAVQLTLIDSARIFCPAFRGVNYCRQENSPFDTRTLSYGWNLYRVSKLP